MTHPDFRKALSVDGIEPNPQVSALIDDAVRKLAAFHADLPHIEGHHWEQVIEPMDFSIPGETVEMKVSFRCVNNETGKLWQQVKDYKVFE